MSEELSPRRRDYFGTFLVTLCTLMYQILLTRIFSVTMWYHFAFMAISISMFGFTVGAILVYRYPEFFAVRKTQAHLGASAFAFGVTIVLSFLTQQSIPFTTVDFTGSIVAAYSVFLIYVVLAVPFICSGICVCLVLTRFPRHVSRLYAADLAGSAAGCVLVIPALRLTDAPTAIVLTGAIACMGALFFSRGQNTRRFRVWAGLTALLLFVFVGYHSHLVRQQQPILKLRWVLGELERDPLQTRWNEFSRVTVHGNPERGKHKPLIHGLSKTFKRRPTVKQYMLVIDLIGATYLTNFYGDMENLHYLKRTITNIAHYLRQDADVLVIGVGGGKDILSAMVFDQKSVTGVEINDLVIHLVTDTYGDFVGHIDEDPRVTLVVDEGRSYVARQDRTFDIIQLTFIDTFAASAAGAFVLTENALYTVESFKEFIRHLSPGGILTVSHFYFRDLPIQMYRMTAIAREALRELGVEHPEKHILMVRHAEGMEFERGLDFKSLQVGFDDVGTFLISRDPFSASDLERISQISERQGFEVVLDPRGGSHTDFEKLARGENLDELVAKYPVRLDAATDDRPFFFHSLELRGLFDKSMAKHGVLSVNVRAIRVLGLLLVVVIVLTLLCILVPMLTTRRTASVIRVSPYLAFFTSIGLGFMFIEIALMQRLMIFLGYPTYALAVVLFSLLLSSGLGSYSTERIDRARLHDGGAFRLAALVFVMMIIGIVSPTFLESFRGATNPIRIAIAISTIFPLGFFMGMAFPMGMKAASTAHPESTPWFWAVNGAASVCGSVLAVGISISASISTTYWAGFACYLVALATFYGLTRPSGPESASMPCP